MAPQGDKSEGIKSADPVAGYRRVRQCLPSMSPLHVFPVSLLSSGDPGRVRDEGWAAEKRWGTHPPAKLPPLHGALEPKLENYRAQAVF